MTSPDFDEAVSVATALHRSAHFAEAVDAYLLALAIDPNSAGVYNNMGSALRILGRVDEAIVAYLSALKLSPESVQAWSNLGNCYKEVGRIDEAIVAYRQAIAHDPQNAPAYNNLAATLEDTGDMAAAIECYRRATKLQPDSAQIASNLVYAMHFSPDYDAAAILAAHRDWNDRFAKALLPLPPGEGWGEGQLAPLSQEPKAASPSAPHPNPLPEGEGTRLRIGYVSADFRHHPIGRFMLPILRHHDRSKFEVFCYSDVAVVQPMTQELRSHAEHSRLIVGMSDEQVAERIREDGIDLLIDLSMHMARNRMLVFARKPAKVQATYLAYCSTTGLDAIDYRITDPYMDSDPAGKYVERSVYLPESYWCYEPPAEVPEVAPLPAVANGYVTFGCLNNFCKASPPALAAWAEILRRVPNSRLLLHAMPGKHRERVLAQFAAAGAVADRVEFLPSQSFEAYFETYGRIDIALDPFPYGGGTTTFDGLWMGVPLVTLRGRTAVGRGGVSILSNLGLTDWIADSPEQYVELAMTMASGIQKLDVLKRSLRNRLKASFLTDAPRFVVHLENAFREMTGSR